MRIRRRICDGAKVWNVVWVLEVDLMCENIDWKGARRAVIDLGTETGNRVGDGTK